MEDALARKGWCFEMKKEVFGLKNRRQLAILERGGKEVGFLGIFLRSQKEE